VGIRIIDANALLDKHESLYMKGHVLFHGITAFSVENAPTIDPETLPVVLDLRKQLEQVTAERDAAVSDIETMLAYGTGYNGSCPFCKNPQCYARGGTKPCLPKWRGPAAKDKTGGTQ